MLAALGVLAAPAAMPAALAAPGAPRVLPIAAVAYAAAGTPPPPGAAPTPWLDPTPYYEATQAGTVWDMGAPGEGQLPAGKLGPSDHIVAIVVDPVGPGYWLLSAGGHVFNFGGAAFRGSPASTGAGLTTAGLTAAAGLVATSDGQGYWVFTTAGAVLAYGDATVEPPVGTTPPAASPAVALVPTVDDKGYWVVRADGTVAAHGDATALPGAPKGYHFQTVVDAARTPTGAGLWLLTAGGQVFASGGARSFGGVGSAQLGQPLQAIVPTSDGAGYWLVAHDGDIHPSGDAAGQAPPVLAFVHTDLTAGDRAVDWAMAQLGKPYKWGGAGPKSFDCSGLTMSAWYSGAGVAIPRIAADQYGAGQRLPVADLLAGDLVFWASKPSEPSTIYHVAMYVGGGHIVQAPYTGQVVSVDWEGGSGFLPVGTAPQV
ncbi:MAG: C40 family peptidase [Acidimicrobiales bacterium]